MGSNPSAPANYREALVVCTNGCIIDPKTNKCKMCGRTLQAIMDSLHVPKDDQEHTLNWLIYRQYQ